MQKSEQLKRAAGGALSEGALPSLSFTVQTFLENHPTFSIRLNGCQTVKYMLGTTGGADAVLALLGRALGRAAHQESQHACWSI